jgi:hypothetical protein
MIKNFKSFNILKEGNFIGYKTPFDKNKPVMIYEMNGDHFEFEKINELKDEFKTKSGIWRIKKRNDNDNKYIDLDDENTKLKIGEKYQFMGFGFEPKYYNNQYYSILNSTDENDFSLVVYSDDIQGLKNNIRINIKDNQ